MTNREEAAEIVPYRDGPLIVRGSFVIRDEHGREIDPGRRTVALCRCGRSRLRPFCDGSHRNARFRAEGGVSPEAERRHPVVRDVRLTEVERAP
jgi:CDGSH-type Zn-finger protein